MTQAQNALPSATYGISDLAAEFDITPRAIRFYEDQGLLAPARQGRGQNRIYSQRDRTRLKLTLRGKRLGLALSEVRELVDMYESPRDEAAQLSKFLGILAAHRAQLLQQREDIEVMLTEIAAFEEGTRKRLAVGAPEPPASGSPRKLGVQPKQPKSPKSL
jgi:DNA-binding transcriptional MerR regulator